MSKINVDIRKNDNVLDALNAVINNGGIAELKQEYNHGKENLVVVEITRKVKTHKE